MKKKTSTKKPAPSEESALKAILKGLDTQGYKKLWSYFAEVIRTEKFKKKMAVLRAEFDIPEGGFPLQKNFPPKEWKYRLDNPEWNERVEAVCNAYDLHPSYWRNVIENVLFYDSLELVFSTSYDLCLLIDLKEGLKGLDSEEKKRGREIQKADDKHFPLAIRISPYASERDIVDFVRRNFTALIEPNQKRYQKESSTIGKVRQKKSAVQERNDFIYKNRHLPRKELMRLTNDKFAASTGAIDYSYVGTIIRLETKKQKEV